MSFRHCFFFTVTHIAQFPLYYSAMQQDLIAARRSLLWSLFRISKAFDAVNYDILLSKLYYYGVRGTPLNWFKNYLHDRTQFVTINNTQSSYETLDHSYFYFILMTCQTALRNYHLEFFDEQTQMCCTQVISYNILKH